MEVFMGKPISVKCLECSKTNWRGLVEPECFHPTRCARKRNYYRYLDVKRQYERKRHHYLKYCQGNCALCSATENLQAHHIQSQANGGEHTKSNVMTLCYNCHQLITRYYQAIRGLRQVEA